MNNDLLTSHEAAEMVGVAEGTLRTWRARKINLPYVVLRDGRSIRYERAAVEEFLSKRNEVAQRVEVQNGWASE